ncbi:MAG: hypothetical protein IKP40_08815 [Clostridia bacterium]|nr:hypothetical protein [Clostridia bacterium]
MAGYGFNIGLSGRNARALTEEEAEEIAGALRYVYGRARETMLETVSRRLARGVRGYGWAERKTSEVLAAHAQIGKQIEWARRERDGLLGNVMERAALTGAQRFYADMGAVLGDTVRIHPNSAKPAYILSDLRGKLDAGERRILRQFDDKYALVIGDASAKMATGVVNTRQAVGEALQTFADNGIDGFVDRAGRHWRLEDYAEMAVLTAIERSTISGYVDTMQSYGYDLAVIDGHAGSCPICEAWEGVIVSVSGQNPDYPSLDEAESAGCFHPRCMHGLSTYYEGLSRAPEGGFRNEPRPVREDSREYTARSRQRYCERMARKYRDRAIVAQNPQQKRQAVNKAREWSAEAERQRELQFHSVSGKITTAGSIYSPIEQRNTGKGIPGAIIHMDRPLNNRQQTLLNMLPGFGSTVIVPRSSVNMTDLAALTAFTGNEFAMFTKGAERMIVRGSAVETPVDINRAGELRDEGYRWSGHTHPGTDDSSLIPSSGDHSILEVFGQDRSEIYNSLGHHGPIWRDE